MAEDEFLPLTITELGGDSRQVVLTGPDLPRDRSGWFKFGSTQRGKDTYYPGSPEPTTQILGPEPREVSFGGEFNSGRRRGASGVTPVALMQALEAMHNRGELATVAYGPVEKVCRWLECEFQIHTLSRIFYALRFKIVRTGLGPKVRIVKETRDLPSVQAVLNAARKVQDLLAVLPAGLGSDRIQRAQAAVGRVLSAAGSVDAILAKARGVGQILTPADARTALRFADTVGASTGDTHENVRSLDWGFMTGSTFGLLSTAGISALGAISAAQQLTTDSLGLHARVKRLAGETDQDAVYVSAQGDTLRTLASRFYGAPDRWRQIADANGLETAFVDPGVRLVIPRVGVGLEAR